MKRKFLALAATAAVTMIGTFGSSGADAACLVTVPILASCSGGNCTVNTGTCRGHCTVNVSYCGTYCRSAVNAGWCY